MNQPHSINQEQRLYVLKSGDGVTCLGFDVAEDRARMYAAAMGETLADVPAKGTQEHYDWYREIERRYMRHPAANNTTFSPNTPDEVKRVLEQARANHTRVRLFYGKDGKDWHEEFDMEGYIGRTMGAIKSPILVANNRSAGGGLILTDCIVKIIETRGRRVLYQHPNYNGGKYEIRPAVSEGYAEGVWIDGQLHAQFTKPGQARRWVWKMSGGTVAA